MNKMNQLQSFLDSNQFIVLGGHKCGTSSLHAYLAQHPEITMPKTKGQDLLNEVNLDLEKYLDSYNIPDSETVYGEVSSVYLYSDTVRTRIKENFPNVKLIIILRNPVDRSFSNYNVLKKSTFKNLDFMDICRQPSEYINSSCSNILTKSVIYLVGLKFPNKIKNLI